MKKDYKIYCLKHPITKEIRYIGATVCTLNQRLSHHKYSALKKKVATHIAKWIRSLDKEKLFPIIELIENCSNSNWEEREKYWISKFSNLTNIKEGGKGIIINRDKTGIERSIEAHKKAIVMLDKQFNFIKEFDSIKSCAQEINVVESAISNATKTKNKGCKGFIFLKRDDWINKNYIKEYRGHYKDVYQYDLNMHLIKKYNALFEITIAQSKHIHTACINNWKHKGFYWSYSIKNKI